MTTTPIGAVIDLRWPEDYDPTAWYVRGHVPEAEAIAAVREHLEAEAEDGTREHVPELGSVRHGFARWGLGMDEDGIAHRQFYAPAKPGRGAFKVTEVVDVEDLAARKRQREAIAAHVAELEAWVRACYPEATEIRAHGYPIGEGHVRFRLPELAGDVFRKATETTVQIQARDRETWERLYAPQPDRPRRPTFAAFLALALAGAAHPTPES